MKRIGDTALLVFAFVLPLSTAASEIALGIAVLAWVAGRPWSRSMPAGLRGLGIATLALAGAWLLASACSPEPLASLVHAHPTQNEAFGEAFLALAGKPLHAHS